MKSAAQVALSERGAIETAVEEPTRSQADPFQLRVREIAGGETSSYTAVFATATFQGYADEPTAFKGRIGEVDRQCRT